MRPALRPLARLLRPPHPHPPAPLRRCSMSAPLDRAALDAAVAAQGIKVRDLKIAKAAADVVDPEIKALLRLKEQLKQLTLADAPAAGASKAAPAAAFMLKTPKGTRDWEPLSMALRARIFDAITRVFQRHGAVTIDTPVFERREILSGKYGEDSKLIYDLQDQGGELCSLRYDLTVPFARFVAMNPTEYGSIKRYHIAKVYRRDQPALSKGRFREFYQCDFDIAGVYDPMVPDAEILLILVEALDALGIENFTVKLNHRKILDGLFAVCGVPADKTRAISSAVDKLDKSPWSEVRREMTVDKGLDEQVADRIGEYVKLKGGAELLEKLSADAVLTGNKMASEGLKDMALLFGFLEVFGIMDRISFDLSLARGLDYYTGIIYEAVTAASAPPSAPAAGQAVSAPAPAPKKAKKKLAPGEEEEDIDESSVGVGSIAAGGRYDHLVGMFSGSKKPDAVPCVGVSIGVERVFAIMMARLREQEAAGEKSSVRAKPVDVFVMSMGGDGFLKERMKTAKMLWDAGVKAEFLYKTKPKPAPQWAAIEKDAVPYTLIIAPEEWAAGTVRVKKQGGKDSEEGQGKGEVVALAEVAEYLKRKLAEP
ncbi:histidyl-tRNA synthetase [Tilletiopsis washingtonensis]|uniref:Histidine--tRNA ligase, mitochondrial n=1 Tax=Tilletiopsis washingtonensis TaxID=58919 RepID=A0A316ZJM0_9BASI|nr:histidyl-tRNA synthetase [Tilletiopsis washingtonensis]PWO00484.1 histidyl-tRNA synthetase [Tilletiopsis washingtonensis]